MIQLEPSMVSTLFWRKKTVTAHEDGLIKFSIKQRSYEYQIYDPVAFFTLQNRRVKVYYDERNMSEVHIFDCENKFLGYVEPRLTNDGDLVKLERHRKGRKAIDRFAKEQKRKWERSNVPKKAMSEILEPQFHDFLLDETDPEHDLFQKLNGIDSNNKKPMLL